MAVNVMAKVALISCSKAKEDVPSPNTIKAELLYKSPLFKKALRYAKNVLKADRIFILSAKHHLLNLDCQISEYDYTLNGKKANVIKEWSDEVRKQLIAEGVDFVNDEIFILAGKNYYKYLITDAFSNVNYVYHNMKIGQILSFLSE